MWGIRTQQGWPMVHLRPEPIQLRGFVLVAFWLIVKIIAGLVIGAALFETIGLVIGLINVMAGG